MYSGYDERGLAWSMFLIEHYQLIIGLSIAIVLFAIICSCRMYARAGKPWWGVLIPVYNIILYAQITHGAMCIVVFVASTFLQGIIGGAGISAAINKNWTLAFVLSIIQIILIVVSIVYMIKLMHRLCVRFGYGAGMTILSILPITSIIPTILFAFGKKHVLDEYEFSSALHEKNLLNTQPQQNVQPIKDVPPLNETKNQEQVYSSNGITQPVREKYEPVYDSNEKVYDSNEHIYDSSEKVYDSNVKSNPISNPMLEEPDGVKTSNQQFEPIKDVGMPDFGADL